MEVCSINQFPPPSQSLLISSPVSKFTNVATGKGTVSIEGGFPGLRHSLCFSELIREDIVSSFMTQAARGTERMEEGRGKEQRETRGGGVSLNRNRATAGPVGGAGGAKAQSVPLATVSSQDTVPGKIVVFPPCQSEGFPGSLLAGTDGGDVLPPGTWAGR